LDQSRSLHRQYAAPHGVGAPWATGAAQEMTFKPAQLSWRGDQAITKIGIAFEEFGARHGDSLLPSDEDRVPGLCPQPPPGRGVGGGQGLWGAYSSRGPLSSAKLFRARLRRLFTVPRLQPVMSAISA